MRCKFALGLAPVLMVATTPARAQGIPVHDALQYAQLIQQVTNSGLQVEKAVAQIQQLEASYQSFSKITRAASLAPLLNNSAVRNILPPDMSDMATLLSGNPPAAGALGALARQFQTQYALPPTAADGLRYSADVDAAYATYLSAINGGAATMMALGSNTLAIGTERTSGLTDLQNQISTAKDPKDAMDLNVRATIENAQATNDLMKLQAIRMSQQAQGDLLLKQYWASRSRAANRALSTAAAQFEH